MTNRFEKRCECGVCVFVYGAWSVDHGDERPFCPECGCRLRDDGWAERTVVVPETPVEVWLATAGSSTGGKLFPTYLYITVSPIVDSEPVLTRTGYWHRTSERCVHKCFVGHQGEAGKYDVRYGNSVDPRLPLVGEKRHCLLIEADAEDSET